MANINDFLPEENLLNIFSFYIEGEGHEEFVRKIPRVCKLWNRLSSENCLWKRIPVRNWDCMVNASRRGLLYNTQSLENEYESGKTYSADNLSAVLKNVRDLKKLDLWNVNVGSDDLKLVTEYCPHIESLRLRASRPTLPSEWDHFLTVCGSTLRSIDLKFYAWHEPNEEQHHLLIGITTKCPELEKLAFFSLGDAAPVPMLEIRNKCANLREVQFAFCKLVAAERNDYLGCGFKKLKKFIAISNDCDGLDVGSLLKDSTDLELLEFQHNKNFIFHDIVKIPSNRVSSLSIALKDPDLILDDPYENLENLVQAVQKWKSTLTVLKLERWFIDISSVFTCLLNDNPNLKLECLSISDSIDLSYVKKFVENCKTLIHVEIGGKSYKGRENIEREFEKDHEMEAAMNELAGPSNISEQILMMIQNAHELFKKK